MRLLATAALLVTLSASLPAQQPSQVDVVNRLAQHLDSLAARGDFSGVVVLAKNDSVVFQHAYGHANRETRQENTVQTAFNLGSINKVFTSTSIRQLVAAGKISLDSTIAHYLPDYPNQAVAAKVTVQQLLNMTAGLGGNIFGTPASGKRADIRKLADFLPLFANEPLLFEPGSKNQYCNACFVVLGLIIERVSGESYYDYVREHVYDPAGMTHTAHYRSDALPADVAIGYTRGREDAPPDAPLHANTEELPGIGSSAGGGYSTALDLLQFVSALRAHKVPSGPPPGIGIAGGAGGINSAIEGDMPGGYDLIVMTNLDPPAAEIVARWFRSMIGARD